MKWNRFTFSLLLMGLSLGAQAEDSIGTNAAQAADSISTKSGQPSRYDRFVKKRHQQWDALIPTQFVIQNAGNMGLLSAGAGWSYAHGHLETHVLFGYIPAHQSTRGKLTTTVKENYIPWRLPLSKGHEPQANPLARGWSVSPLTASIYLNTVYGHEFWKSQPRRYPNKYYEFMSTKFRLNVALGQSITWQIPHEHRRNAQSITLFYELSSCDLYLRSKFIDHNVPLKDILGLSIGVKLQTL